MAAAAAAAPPTLRDRLKALTDTSDFTELLDAVQITGARQTAITNQLRHSRRFGNVEA